ncbi:MAG: CHASE2 domain-containing protein [Proteobacteria bacterium]|nr:CHASE2 domain-containing protein [Pseudomonadota bacterium]
MFPRIISWILAVTLTVAAFYAGTLDILERPLLELRYKLTKSEADPQLVIVEIDPKSLREIGTWPWKRSLHALLIDRLTAARAETIVFDIDFSLASTEEEDAKLASALARRSGHTILAAFRQWSEADGQFVDIEPLDIFAEHAEIASANIIPDTDGLLWRHSREHPWKNSTLPSIASLIAENASSTVRPQGALNEFWIDYGISPGSFARYSLSDVAGGRTDPANFSGKTVLIGATAVELGDNVATPLYQSLPGVFVQMLAAQSILKGRDLHPLPNSLTLILLLLTSAFVSITSWQQRPGQVIVSLASIDILVFVAAIVVQSTSVILIPVAPIIVGTLLSASFTFLTRFRQLGLKVVTERVARLRYQTMMANVANNAFDAIITTDRDGKIETLNLAAKRIFDTNLTTKNQVNMSEFYIPSKLTNKQDFTEILALALYSDEPRRILCKRSTGQAFHADLAVTTLNPDQESELILVMRDIDRSVKAERRAFRRERELKQAKTRAELANRAKSEFLANMSHELKTPLNAVMGFAEMMHNEVFGPLGSKKYIEYSQDIYDGGARLLATVTDVLDFARIEDGELVIHTEQFDLSDMITRVGILASERATAAGLSFNTVISTEGSFVISSDERLLKQALNSLLANAIKFNSENGFVILQLQHDDKGDFMLSIEDSGIGIAEDQIETCFKAFGQANRGLQRQFEGAGLGLTLSKKYIEALGGTLDVESIVGTGTTMTITLPSDVEQQTQLDMVSEAHSSSLSDKLQSDSAHH